MFNYSIITVFRHIRVQFLYRRCSFFCNQSYMLPIACRFGIGSILTQPAIGLTRDVRVSII